MNALLGTLACLVRLVGPDDTAPAAAVALEPGVRIRVSAPTIGVGRIAGSVASLANAQLTLRESGRPPMTLPLAAVTSLDISLGRSRVRGLKKGVVKGVVAGVLLGALAYGACTDCKDLPSTFGERVLEGAALGGAAGIFYGGVLGAIIGAEQWEPVPLGRPPTVSWRIQQTRKAGRGLAVVLAWR